MTHRAALTFALALSLAAAVRASDAPPPAAGGAAAPKPTPIALGSKIPSADVKMKNVDGKEVTVADVRGAKGTLVVFTCNACPFARAWESRIVAVGGAALKGGIGVIAVNSNDPKVAAQDDYDTMVQRAKDKAYGFPYVVDATSDVARAFGAGRTPEAFLFDAEGKLVYHGAIDDNAESAEAVTSHWLSDAVDSLAAGRAIATAETKAIGCGIKFRSRA